MKFFENEYIRRIIMIVCVGVIIFSAYMIISGYYNYYKANNFYGSILNDYKTERNISDDIDNTDEDKDKAGKKNDTGDTVFMDVAKLKKKYPDIAGWLVVPGTKVNYPVVKSEGEYYLRRDLDNNYLYAGTLFMFNTASLDPMDQNISIFGHHMRNGSMFGELDNILRNPDKYDSFYFYDENIIYKYSIYAVYNTNNPETAIQSKFSDDEYGKFLKNMKNIRDIGITPDRESRFMTLSTCTYDSGFVDTGRLVVQGIMVKRAVTQ